MNLVEEIEKLKSTLPAHVKLVAISKTKPVELIREAYNSGHKIFGENKVQELVGKYEMLPKDTEWHMVGHLQTNKVKYITPFISMIHGVDNFKLLKVINKEAKKNNRIISCLLQIKIAKEDSKFGLTRNEVEQILESDEFDELSNVKILGLMGMASFSDDENIIRDEFRELVSIFKIIQQKYFTTVPEFKELSMGMSTDYKIAIEEGSTMIRIGSLIFGERVYP
ncbi:Pyridoxal phosphate homeostasis protein [subsurface metagenome]